MYHKNMIPRDLRSLFWDINADHFNPASYPDYTIARVLEYGNETAVKWLRETFSEPEIKRLIATERRLTRRSANFWALAYGIPASEVAALRPSSAGRLTAEAGPRLPLLRPS